MFEIYPPYCQGDKLFVGHARPQWRFDFHKTSAAAGGTFGVTYSVLRRLTTGRDCLGYGFLFRRNDRPDDHPPPFWKKRPNPGAGA
jgi:hypothetical protein